MSDGRLDEMSIGFRAIRQDWSKDYTQRTITEARLFDVSVVNTGMSPNTAASLRSLDEAVRAFTDNEEWDDDTLRRAIAHLESLLPSIEEEREPQPDHVGLLQELWAKRLVA